VGLSSSATAARYRFVAVRLAMTHRSIPATPQAKRLRRESCACQGRRVGARTTATGVICLPCGVTRYKSTDFRKPPGPSCRVAVPPAVPGCVDVASRLPANGLATVVHPRSTWDREPTHQHAVTKKWAVRISVITARTTPGSRTRSSTRSGIVARSCPSRTSTGPGRRSYTGRPFTGSSRSTSSRSAKMSSWSPPQDSARPCSPKSCCIGRSWPATPRS